MARVNANGPGHVTNSHTEPYIVELSVSTPRNKATKRSVPRALHNHIRINVHHENVQSISKPDPATKSPTVSVTGSLATSHTSPVSEKIKSFNFKHDFDIDLSALSTTKNEKQLSTAPVRTVHVCVCTADDFKYDRYKLSKFYVLLVNLIMPSISIFTVSFLAFHFKEPFIFPSLGPTLFLHFSIPDHPPASPLNTIFGHLLGICVGYTALIITGLQDHKAIFVEGISFERIGCASFAVGTTCFLMIILLLNHPPAAATTLIVALGILTTFEQFRIMMLAVVILALQSFIFNRIIRADAVYPLWTRNGAKIRDHLRKLFRCRYIYNAKTRTCAFCKYDRSHMKFVHVLFINLLCPAFGLAIIGTIGHYTNLPFLFPSVGPTAFVQFSLFQESPASPKNTLITHFMGIMFASLGLFVFGLTDNPGVAVEGISLDRIGCIAHSLGLICFFMDLFKIGHPPAAATTLIVAMGILKGYIDLAVLMATIVMFTIFSFFMNRMLRNDAIYPIWGKIRDEEDMADMQARLERQDSMHGVLEEEMGYHNFPSL